MAIETAFVRIGARVRVRSIAANTPVRSRERWPTGPERSRPVAIDVLRDRRGEYFDIGVRPDVDVDVLQAEARTRHLLLLTRVDGDKARFLCGHDERHWFVAAIPESRPVSTVRAAKDALRPEAVDGASFVRQGEWFFVPFPAFAPSRFEPIRRWEPMVRSGGSTPHLAAEAVRSGGTTVYLPQIPLDGMTRRQREALDERFARGVTEARLSELRRQHPRWRWTSMLRDPELYVRGAIRHPDHATVTLPGWHRVYLNTESQAKAMAHVVFLD